MVRNHFFALLMLSLTASLSQAQSVCRSGVSGRVLASDTKQPLIGATVYVRELGNGAITDTNGYFRLTGLCPGLHIVHYHYVGFVQQEQTIQLTSDTLQMLAPVMLRPDNQTLQEVVVTDQRSEARQLLQVQTDLSGNALLATRGQSLGESLKNLPGLYTLQTGPSIAKPIIHGLYSNRILTLNNGVRQEDQQWGSEHAPQIDPFVADRITVIKGAASIRYGSDAIGGVILLEPRPMPAKPGIHAALDAVGGTNGRQGTVSALVEQGLGGKLAGLSWRVQGTLKRSGYARTPNYFLENTSAAEANGSGTVSYVGRGGGVAVFYSHYNARIGLFTGAQVGSLTDFYAALDRPEPLQQPGFSYALDRPYQHVQHDLLKINAFTSTHRWGKLTATYARQQNIRREYDRLSFSRVTDPELYLKLVTQTVELTVEHTPVKTQRGGQWSGSAGMSGLTQGNVRRFLFLIPNYRSYGAGVFALERYAYRRWTLEGGLRYDYRWLRAFFRDEATSAISTRTRHWQNLTGSLGAVYQLTPQLALSGNLSTAWRAPNVNDLYSNGLHQSAVAYERGNPELKVEQSYNATVSVSYTGQRLSAELDAYANRIANYIYLRPDSVPIVRQRGAFPAFSYTQIQAIFRGVDVSLRYKLTDRLMMLSKTSLLVARDQTNQDYVAFVPPNRTENGLRYEWPETGRLSGLYVGLNSQYVARQHRAPAVSERQEGGLRVFTGDFAPPPPAYTLFGAELGFTYRLGKQPLSVILTGTNLLNRAYRDYLDRFRYFADEPGRNVVLRLKLPLDVGRTTPGRATYSRAAPGRANS